MRRYFEAPGYPAEERIRELKSELYCARRDIVHLMPSDVVNILMSYYSCQSHRDFGEWQRSAIDQILAMAVPDPDASYFGPRGYCPLCKGGSSGPYAQGFTLPEGLRRHLEGYGNTHQCPVTRAAFNMAREALWETFEAADKETQRKEQERRKTERLFLTEPWSPPKLLEEGLWRRNSRNTDQFAFAEERLRQLGFESEISQNVVTYKFRQSPYAVLADLREVGRINFYVYDEKKKKPRNAYKHRESFYLLDDWKNDLPNKFRARLTSSIESLSNGNS